MIDFSCISMMIPGDSLRQQIENASRWGFKGIELVIAEADNIPVAIGETKRMLQDNNIQVSAVIYTHRFMNRMFDSDYSARDRCMQNIRAGIDLSSELESNFVWTPEYISVDPPPLYEPFDPTYRGRYEMLLRNLETLASYSKRHDVLIYLEPINRYESTFFHTLAEGMAICEKVAIPSLCLLADFFHLNIEESDMNRSLYLARKYVKHIHLSDSNRRLPGYGHIDFISSFHTLLDLGYSGFLTLECRIDRPVDQELPKCLAFLRSCMDIAEWNKKKTAQEW
jgi:sugar phosphate isomerase/epimerase